MKMKALYRGIVMVLSIVFALCNSRDSRAVTLDVVPALTLEGDWDSNVFNSSTERSDFVLIARPSLTFALHTLGTTFNLQGSLTAEEYSRFDELDRVAAAKILNLYPTDPIRVTPSLNMRPAAYFVEMTDFGRRAFADPVPGGPGTLPGEQVDLTAVSGRTTIREYSGSLEVNYTLTDKIDTYLRGSALRQEQPDAPTSSLDFWVYGAQGNSYYRVSPRLQMGPYLRYNREKYDAGLIVDVYQGSLAARYVVREGQIVEARGGISYSHQDFEPPVTSTAPYGFLSLDSTWESLHMVASTEYGIEQGGSVGAATTRFLARILMDKGFSSRTRAEIIGAFQRSWVKEPAVPETFTIHTASATIRYLAYAWATVHIGGRYFLQTSDVPATRDLRRSAVFLGVDLSDTFSIY